MFFLNDHRFIPCEREFLTFVLTVILAGWFAGATGTALAYGVGTLGRILTGQHTLYVGRYVVRVTCEAR